MSDEQTFLNALTANPADDLCRLAYSDWLEEREQIGKATYLRLIVRAVEQIANGEELGATRDGLWPLITTLDEEWRNAVGKRFDVRLESVRPDRKILAIKTIREMTKWGLRDMKWVVESPPLELTLGCTLEVAAVMQQHIHASESATTKIIIAQPSPPAREMPRDLNTPHRIQLVFVRDAGTEYDRDFVEFQRLIWEREPSATIEPIRQEMRMYNFTLYFQLMARLAPIRPGWSLIPELLEWRRRFGQLHEPPARAVWVSLEEVTNANPDG